MLTLKKYDKMVTQSAISAAHQASIGGASNQAAGNILWGGGSSGGGSTTTSPTTTRITTTRIVTNPSDGSRTRIQTLSDGSQQISYAPSGGGFGTSTPGSVITQVSAGDVRGGLRLTQQQADSFNLSRGLTPTTPSPTRPSSPDTSTFQGAFASGLITPSTGREGPSFVYTPGFLPSVGATPTPTPSTETFQQGIAAGRIQPIQPIRIPVSSTKIAYSKADEAFLGFLPGGRTPFEVMGGIARGESKPLTFKEQVGAVAGANPLLLYSQNREQLSRDSSAAVKRVTDALIKKVPDPLGLKVEGGGREQLLSAQEKKFKIAVEMESAGELDQPRGFDLFKKEYEKEAAIGKDIIKAVKAGQTYEDYRIKGPGQRGGDIIFAGTELIREKPLEIAEIGAQIYVGGKLLATGGQFVSNLIGKGVITTAAANIPIISPTAKFILKPLPKFLAIDLPILVKQSEILGRVTESFAKTRGFTDTQAANIALGARILQAEAFGNIYGSKELVRLGVSKTFGQAFKAKIIPGIAEAVPSSRAVFARTGSVEPFGAGVVFGGDKFLPRRETITTPGFDTLKDPGFKTVEREVTRPEFEKISAGLKEQKFDLKGFENIKFVITDDGVVTEEAVFSLKSPSTTETKFQAGKLLTDITAGTVGAISAGGFGGAEFLFKGTKLGRAGTQGVGYIIDPPELPGDILTGAFTPFGGIKTTATTVPTTSIFVSQQVGNLADITKFGGEISRTKIDVTIEGARFKGTKELIRVDAPPRSPFKTTEFTRTPARGRRGGVPTTINDIVKVDTGVRDVTITNINVPTLSNVPALTGTQVFDVTKTTTNIPALTNIPSLTNIPALTNIPSLTQTQTDTQTDVLQVTNVFTPKLFLPSLPSGGGGGRGFGFGRKGRRTLKFMPSLTAGALGIKGARKAFLTGLEIRAIPIAQTGGLFGIAPTRKRTKKKKKKKK